jgi:hypothetical protein
VGLPSHRRSAQGVWDALYLTLVYWRQAGDPCARWASGEGDRRCDSGGGSRRCAWATKMQTELVNRGTSVGSMDGIQSTNLSDGVGFTWNVGRTIGLPTEGGFAAPLGRLR